MVVTLDAWFNSSEEDEYVVLSPKMRIKKSELERIEKEYNDIYEDW